MSTVEKIHQQVQKLPESSQKEALDFIEFLIKRNTTENSR
jgi:hypothetical protein